MNIFIINEYIKKITQEDIKKFAIKNKIELTEKEIDIIYQYIKTRYKEFINGNSLKILEEIKKEVSPNTYNKIISLYNQYKGYLN